VIFIEKSKQWCRVTICLKSFCRKPNSQNVEFSNSTKVETFCKNSYTSSYKSKHNTYTIFVTNAHKTIYSFLSPPPTHTDTETHTQPYTYCIHLIHHRYTLFSLFLSLSLSLSLSLTHTHAHTTLHPLHTPH
jgi:hypothetical protein